MLIYAKFSYIFWSLDLVDIPGLFLVGKNKYSVYISLYRFKYSTPSFGFCAQVAWTCAYIEYRHPEDTLNFPLHSL